MLYNWVILGHYWPIKSSDLTTGSEWRYIWGSTNYLRSARKQCVTHWAIWLFADETVVQRTSMIKKTWTAYTIEVKIRNWNWSSKNNAIVFKTQTMSQLSAKSLCKLEFISILSNIFPFALIPTLGLLNSSFLGLWARVGQDYATWALEAWHEKRSALCSMVTVLPWEGVEGRVDDTELWKLYGTDPRTPVLVVLWYWDCQMDRLKFETFF